MTIKLVLTHAHPASHLSVAITQHEPGNYAERALGTGETVIPPGETREFYLHQGLELRARELPATPK